MKKFVLTTIFIIVAVVVIGMGIFIVSGIDNNINCVEYTVENDKINNRIRAVCVSDLHCTRYGENQSELIKKIKDCSPDVIFCLGDIFDRTANPEPSCEFIEGISGICPIYAIHGNHEHKTKDHMLNFINELYKNSGIVLLDNDFVTVNINGNEINICGTDNAEEGAISYEKKAALNMIGVDTAKYTVVLNHRPETYGLFINKNIDLVLSGHAHGGQWVIKGKNNGIYAPNQGFFPQYAGGKYTFSDKMTMVVSRGLALSNTILPRVNNPPELTVVNITHKQ